MTTELIKCPCCNSDACSVTTNNDVKIYLCWTCGMTTTSELIDGSNFGCKIEIDNTDGHDLLDIMNKIIEET